MRVRVGVLLAAISAGRRSTLLLPLYCPVPSQRGGAARYYYPSTAPYHLSGEAEDGAARVAQRARDDDREEPVPRPPLVEEEGLAEALVQREVHRRVGRLLARVRLGLG